MSTEVFPGKGPSPTELVGQLTFAQALPSRISLGPVLSPVGAGEPALLVTSTLETSFVHRVCPSVNELGCLVDDSISEKVVANVTISKISYDAEPRNTIDCSTERMECACALATARVPCHYTPTPLLWTAGSWQAPSRRRWS